MLTEELMTAGCEFVVSGGDSIAESGTSDTPNAVTNGYELGMAKGSADGAAGMGE